MSIVMFYENKLTHGDSSRLCKTHGKVRVLRSLDIWKCRECNGLIKDDWKTPITIEDFNKMRNVLNTEEYRI